MPRLGLFAFWVVAGFSMPALAMACACCGLDDTWSQRHEARSGYWASVFRKVELGQGEINDSPAYEVSGDILETRRSEEGFVFETKDGNFELSLGDKVEHRMADVTFALSPGQELVDVAAIYHELIVPAVLSIPEAFRSRYRQDPPPPRLEVKLVLQGVGNGCVDEATFQKWLIKPANQGQQLTGSGRLGSGDPSIAPDRSAKPTRESP